MKCPGYEQRLINPASSIYGALFRSPATSSPGGLLVERHKLFEAQARPDMKCPGYEQRRINPASPIHGALFRSPATSSPGGLLVERHKLFEAQARPDMKCPGYEQRRINPASSIHRALFRSPATSSLGGLSRIKSLGFVQGVLLRNHTCITGRFKPISPIPGARNLLQTQSWRWVRAST